MKNEPVATNKDNKLDLLTSDNCRAKKCRVVCGLCRVLSTDKINVSLDGLDEIK